MIDNIKKAIWRLLMPRRRLYEGFSMKPFDCSLCTTWWVGLAYLAASDNLSIRHIMLVALFAFYSENISYLLIAIKDFLGYISGFPFRKLK